MKIVLNKCCGGYALSEEAYKYMGMEFSPYEKEIGCGVAFENDRSNFKLVECVEVLGDKASDACSKLVVVEIPDGISYEINDDIGYEWVEINGKTY